MRLRPLVTMLALSGLLSLAGCTGTSTDGSRFSLPTFGAPEQWEPPLDEVEAVPEAGQPAES